MANPATMPCSGVGHIIYALIFNISCVFWHAAVLSSKCTFSQWESASWVQNGLSHSETGDFRGFHQAIHFSLNVLGSKIPANLDQLCYTLASLHHKDTVIGRKSAQQMVEDDIF